MTHGESNPLQTLRTIRLMMALKTAALCFSGVFLAGMLVYFGVYFTIGTSVQAWIVTTVMLFAGFIAANVSLYVYHKEVFGL